MTAVSDNTHYIDHLFCLNDVDSMSQKQDAEFNP